MRSFFDSDDSPSSPSLEKLILAELRGGGEFPSSSSSSSSNSSSGRIGSRSPTSTLDFGGGGDQEMRFRLWSVPGQRRRVKSSESDAAPSTPQPHLPASQKVSRCVAGCAGDCTAVCCCPFTVIHILFLKVPVLVASKISETCRRAKRRFSQATYSTATESPGLSPCSSMKLPDSSSVAGSDSPVRLGPEPPPPSLKIPASIQKQMGFGGDHWREFDSPHSSVSGS